MPNLELLSASLISPIIEGLNTRGADVSRHLAKARLPLIMADRQLGLVPRISTLRFLDVVARYTGDPFYSTNCILTAGGERPNRVASISLDQAPTVFEAIRTFVTNANAITTGATITLVISGDWMWVLRRPNNPNDTDSWQAEQFVVASFIKALSYYLVPGWRPQKLKIRRGMLPHKIPDQWSEADIEIANPHTGIGIKLLDVVSETDFNIKLSPPPDSTNQTGLVKPVAYDPASLRSAVLHYLDHETTSIVRVADAFGVSERTFRRRLTAANLSYTELIDESRYARSLELLRDANLSITELALSLGYEYSENFTRAFRKRVGVSPSKYRKMIAENALTN